MSLRLSRLQHKPLRSSMWSLGPFPALPLEGETFPFPFALSCHSLTQTIASPASE